MPSGCPQSGQSWHRVSLCSPCSVYLILLGSCSESIQEKQQGGAGCARSASAEQPPVLLPRQPVGALPPTHLGSAGKAEPLGKPPCTPS